MNKIPELTEKQLSIIPIAGLTAKGEIQKFAPVIDTFLKEHLFADIFSRNNLDYKSLEIATISALASLTNTENQLRSHLKVGKNIGFTQQQFRQISLTVATSIGWQEGGAIDKVLDEMDGVYSADSPIQSSGITIQKVSDTIFSKGNIISGKNFSGIAWLNRLVPDDSIFNCPVGNVTFEPGARTNWHKHPGGQILLVTGGQGFYQERGKPVQLIEKGDVVLIGPDVKHWHGAKSNSGLTHIAINTNVLKGSTVWLKPVMDEEYNNINNK